MARYLLSILCLLFSHSIYSQDTVVTNYPNSDQRWEKIYDDNQKIAENIYHKNGLEWMTVQYNESYEQKWKWYYDDGSPYFESMIINDLLQGEYKIWYENGQLAERIFFKNNLEDGPATFFYPNGQIAMQGYYEKGEMVGPWYFFDRNGKLPNGDWNWKFAASNKTTRIKGTFSKGDPVGSWEYRTTANQGLANQKTFILNFNQ